MGYKLFFALLLLVALVLECTGSQQNSLVTSAELQQEDYEEDQHLLDYPALCKQMNGEVKSSKTPEALWEDGKIALYYFHQKWADSLKKMNRNANESIQEFLLANLSYSGQPQPQGGRGTDSDARVPQGDPAEDGTAQD